MNKILMLPLALFVFISCSRETSPPTTPAQPPTVDAAPVGAPTMPGPAANSRDTSGK